MQPISSAVAVDSYVAPRANASYRRAHVAASLATHASEPPLPALLRPQLLTLSDDDVRGVERRMVHSERAALRDARIAERAARVAAQAEAAAGEREVRLRQRAARRAKVAGEVKAKQLQEEYRTMGMR